MRPRPVVGKAAVPDAVRRLLDKFDYPDRESPTQVIPILPTLGGGTGTGAFIHLTRAATQSIASGGELIDWDTLGLQGVSGFVQAVPTTTVTIQQAGYYNVAVQLGWSSFEGGGTITVRKNGVTVWPPTDDPGLWSTDEGQLFEGTTHAIECAVGDTLSVFVNPDDASAQTLASATFTAYLVDRAVNESGYHELVLSHGPIGYWHLDETSGVNAVDAAGSRDMTYTNGPTLNQTGLMQDGSGSPSVDLTTNDHVLGGDWAEFEFTGTAPFTIECWFVDDLVDAGAIHIIVAKQDASEDGWELLTTEAGGTRLLQGIRETAIALDNVTTPIVIGQTYYVAWTYDGTTMRLYLDGVLVDSAASAISMIATTDNLAFGQKTSEGAVTNHEGLADEVAIYDRALTVAEIQQHYTVGSTS